MDDDELEIFVLDWVRHAEEEAIRQAEDARRLYESKLVEAKLIGRILRLVYENDISQADHGRRLVNETPREEL